MDFTKATIINNECGPSTGYFDIPSPIANVHLRLHVYKQIDGTIVDAAAAIVIAADSTSLECDEGANCIIWYKNYAAYATPMPSNKDTERVITGLKQNPTITLRNGTGFVFHAGKIGYYVRSEIIKGADNMKFEAANGVLYFAISTNENFGILQVLATLKPGDIIKRESEQIPATLPQPKQNHKDRATVTIDLTVKPRVYLGIPCWEVPSNIASPLRITIGRDIDRTWYLCKIDSRNVVNYTTIPICAGTTDTFAITEGTRKFWIVDSQLDNNIDFNIVRVAA